MTVPADEPTPETFPEARVRRRRWGLSVVWVVPLVAAIVAAYLVYGRLDELGPTITIKFKDGDGIKAGQTEIRYRGVPIGQVRAIDLSADQEHVVVTARLRRSATSIARADSVFWVVRPEVGPATISGLSTVLTGPYIQVLPGSGKHGVSRAGSVVRHQGLDLDGVGTRSHAGGCLCRGRSLLVVQVLDSSPGHGLHR